MNGKIYSKGSFFALQIPSDRKRLISEVLDLHIALDSLLDELNEHGYIEFEKKISFRKKIDAVNNSEIKNWLILFNKIRNQCAHERSNTNKGVEKLISRCDDFISKVKISDKFIVFKELSGAPLKAAVMTVYDDLLSMYKHRLTNGTELDGFHLDGQKSLSDKIKDLIG